MNAPLTPAQVFERLWRHFVVHQALPPLTNGRLTPDYCGFRDGWPATGTACAVFLQPLMDHRHLNGSPVSSWVAAATRDTPMLGQSRELLQEIEQAVRECLRSTVRDQYLDGGTFLTLIEARLEAIRKDFRIAAPNLGSALDAPIP